MAVSASKTKSKASAKKPYDKPVSTPAVDKGKGKATSIGQPATLGQSSRKGKKAWRKNVDITQEEAALEEVRQEERTTGGRIADQTDEQLFIVDTGGDAQVAKQMQKAKPVRRSLQILQERSAVPSLTSHTTKSFAKKQKITAAEKERLLRIARKNTVSSDGLGLGSAVITTGTAARGENLRDVWTEVDEVPEPAEGEWGREGKPAPKPKAPIALQRQRELLLSQTGEKALPIPHAGLSYNPGLDSHQELLERAIEEEKQKLAREADEARRVAVSSTFIVQPEDTDGTASGMKIGHAEEGGDDEEDEPELDAEGEPVKRKVQKRKTQTERNKAQRAREARRQALLKESTKRLRQSLAVLPSITSSLEQELSAKEQAVAERRARKAAVHAKGLSGGEKVGKHRVRMGDVAVQLEEDLSENLRGLKPEGNLFKDRFLSLQQRALVEPRMPQLPKRRKLKVKEYEKHAWKRFQ